MKVPIERIDRVAWSFLSQAVLRGRFSADPTVTNDVLRQALARDPGGPLAPALTLWIGDNLKLAGRFESAIGTYREIVTHHGRKSAPGSRRWGAVALQSIAVCYERLGQTTQAARAYEQIGERFSDGMSSAFLSYQIGRIFAAAGRQRVAREAYRVAQRGRGVRGPSGLDYRDLARRALERDRAPGPSRAMPEALAGELATALRDRDGAALAKLADRSYFGVGTTHVDFVPFERVAKELQSDLEGSDIAVDPTDLTGTTQRLTLGTSGWKGRTFSGRVGFFLERSAHGWHWTGVQIPGLNWMLKRGEGEFPRLPSGRKKSGPPPPDHFDLKCPWPAGRHFRAGGLNRYLSSMAPIWGSFIQAYDTLFSECGYGVYGFYYDQGSTHRGINKFAIDFTSYQQGVPFLDRALSTYALAAHSGVIINMHDGVAFGDMSNVNFVQIDWLTAAEQTAFVQSSTLTPGRFRSSYLHLDKPLFVSLNMLVQQGTRLGFMDHTGNSAMPHLHFVLYDRDQGFQSVRPTPMDGQPLEDGNDGDCLGSSNAPFP